MWPTALYFGLLVKSYRVSMPKEDNIFAAAAFTAAVGGAVGAYWWLCSKFDGLERDYHQVKRSIAECTAVAEKMSKSFEEIKNTVYQLKQTLTLISEGTPTAGRMAPNASPVNSTQNLLQDEKALRENILTRLTPLADVVSAETSPSTGSFS
eukprot:IDg16935t1